MTLGEFIVRALLAAAIHEWGAVLIGFIIGCLATTLGFLVRRHFRRVSAKPQARKRAVRMYVAAPRRDETLIDISTIKKDLFAYADTEPARAEARVGDR